MAKSKVSKPTPSTSDSKSKSLSTAVSDQQSTRSGSAASVVSRKASTIAKKGLKATKAIVRPFKKLKRSLSTCTQSSVADDNADPSVADDNADPAVADDNTHPPSIDVDGDNSTPIDVSSSDSELDPQKELGMEL